MMEREGMQQKTADEERRERNRRKAEEAEFADDILEIPELGGGEEDLTMQVAAPPLEYRHHQKMQTLSQLDSNTQFQLPMDTAIDLSILTASLSPSDRVMEADELWRPETLLTELGPELDKILAASTD